MRLNGRRAAGALVGLGLLAITCQRVDVVAPETATLTLFANPAVIPLGGVSVLNIGVFEASGQPVPDNTKIILSTNLGAIEPSQVGSRGGFATASYVASTTAGIATVRASSGTAPAKEIMITVGGSAGSINLLGNPTQLPVGGGTVALSATVLDDAGRPLAGRSVTFSTSRGSLASAGVVQQTNGSGIVTDSLVTSADATVTATVVGSSLTSTVAITVRNSSVMTITVTANPTSLGAGGGTSAITATVVDAAGLALAGVPLVFSANAGSMSPQGVVTTGASGTTTASLTTTQTATVTAQTTGGIMGSVTVDVAGTTNPALSIFLSVSPSVIDIMTPQPSIVADCSSDPTEWHLTLTATVTANGVGAAGYQVIFDADSIGSHPNLSAVPGRWCTTPILTTDSSGIAVAYYALTAADQANCRGITTPCSAALVCSPSEQCCCGMDFSAEIIGRNRRRVSRMRLWSDIASYMGGGTRACACTF